MRKEYTCLECGEPCTAITVDDNLISTCCESPVSCLTFPLEEHTLEDELQQAKDRDAEYQAERQGLGRYSKD